MTTEQRLRDLRRRRDEALACGDRDVAELLAQQLARLEQQVKR